MTEEGVSQDAMHIPDRGISNEASMSHPSKEVMLVRNLAPKSILAVLSRAKPHSFLRKTKYLIKFLQCQ